MDSDNKIMTRPGLCVLGSNGESIQQLDIADVDTKVITSSMGKVVVGGTAESLNSSWFYHHTDSNEMQRWHRWIDEQTEVFEGGDHSNAGELLEACREMLLDCLNCEKFPEVSPWDRSEILEFISAAKFALISVANAFQADAERLITTIEASDNNTYWFQLSQKIDKQNNAARSEKIKRTRQADYPATVDECKEVFDSLIQSSQMLRRESDDVKAIRNWRDNDYLGSAKPSLKRGKLDKIARRLVELTLAPIVETPTAEQAPADKPRRGRKRKAESELLWTQCLALVNTYPALMDNPEKLASDLGVSKSTAIRLIDKVKSAFCKRQKTSD